MWSPAEEKQCTTVHLNKASFYPNRLDGLGIAALYNPYAYRLAIKPGSSVLLKTSKKEKKTHREM